VYADGLYSVSYRDENQYYWRPAKGDFAVAETFYKKNAPGRAAGAWSGGTAQRPGVLAGHDEGRPQRRPLTAPPAGRPDAAGATRCG
jgi:hypothetical protein